MRARTGRLQSCTRVQARPCARISFVWPACAHAQVLVLPGTAMVMAAGAAGAATVAVAAAFLVVVAAVYPSLVAAVPLHQQQKKT